MDHSIKIHRARSIVANAGHHTGPVTWGEILGQIEPALYDSLTSAELANVAITAISAHHAGRKQQRIADTQD